MPSFINSSIHNGVQEIELNRREKKNALDADMYASLAQLVTHAQSDEQVRTVLIRGQEDLFCAGNDLKDFMDGGPGTAPALSLMEAVQRLDKPLVAAVGGIAIGLGTTLLFHCDVVYATPSSRFGMPFVALGVCPEFGSSILAPASAGYRLAAEMILSAEVFDVSKAREMGLINHIVEPDQLFTMARSKAERLASMPPQAVRQAKRMLKQHAFPNMSAVFKEELSQFNAMLKAPEAQQAIAQFFSPASKR